MPRSSLASLRLPPFPTRRAGAGVAMVGLVVSLGAVAPVARAQGCDTVSSRTSLARYSGRPIRSVRIAPRSVAAFPGAARGLERLHVRTREGTIRHQLLIVPRDTVDTLAIAESLRRLRRLRYLVDASVEAADCGGDSLDVTVRTVDGWSTKPGFQYRSRGAAFELKERNLFGTGREAAAAVRSDQGRIGVGAAVRDPWFLGKRVLLDLGTLSYRDGNDWYAAVGRQEASIFDRWGVEAEARRSTRDPTAPRAGAPSQSADAGTFRRTRAGVLVTRRLFASEASVIGIIGGAEYERTGLVARPDDPLVGPERVQREIAALDIGIARRSVAYDTVTWLLPRDAIVDIPLSLETEVLVGAGRERIRGSVAGHVDLWAGRMWLPGPGSLTVADIWASGYRTDGGWSAATLRAALGYHRAAARGLWTAHLAVEHLADPDPDLRALASADPTAAALPECGRLAESAASASLERSLRLRHLTGSWSLEGAVFTAASGRWDPPDGNAACGVTAAASPLEHMYAGVLGIGLRLAPTKAGRATARLDLGLAAIASPGVRRRPFIAVSITPALDQDRQRDGRRPR